MTNDTKTHFCNNSLINHSLECSSMLVIQLQPIRTLAQKAGTNPSGAIFGQGQGANPEYFNFHYFQTF